MIYWLLFMNKRGTNTWWIVHRNDTSWWIPTDGLIAEFLLATDANDTSPTANNGVATWVVFAWWFATFDADTDSVIAPSNVAYNITTGTMSFKIQTISTIIWCIACRNDNVNDSFFISIADIIDASDPWKVTFYWWNSATTQSTTPVVNDWSWHTVVITYEPWDVNVYIDGVLSWTFADDLVSGSMWAPLNIGYRAFDTPWHTIDGWLARYRWYNRILNSGEIAEISNEADPT